MCQRNRLRVDPEELIATSFLVKSNGNSPQLVDDSPKEIPANLWTPKWELV